MDSHGRSSARRARWKGCRVRDTLRWVVGELYTLFTSHYWLFTSHYCGKKISTPPPTLTLYRKSGQHGAHAACAQCERSREADTRPHRGPAVGQRVGDRGSRALGARLHQRQRHHRRPEVWHDCARCTACTIEPQQHPLLIDSLAASLLPTRYQASCCASCSGFAARLTGRSCTSSRGRAASHSFAGIYCSYPRSRTAADG